MGVPGWVTAAAVLLVTGPWLLAWLHQRGVLERAFARTSDWYRSSALKRADDWTLRTNVVLAGLAWASAAGAAAATAAAAWPGTSMGTAARLGLGLGVRVFVVLLIAISWRRRWLEQSGDDRRHR